MTARREEWVPILDEAELEVGALKTCKHGPHQLVVGRSETDGVFALDNRCPHEGYPLAQGDLKGGELTCCWHNWKFDVADGACLIGTRATVQCLIFWNERI